MATIIDTDRGPGFSLFCLAVAFGIVIGAVCVPLLIISMWITSFVYLGMLFLGELIATILGLVVYYTGAFVVVTISSAIYPQVAAAVSSVAGTVCDAASAWWYHWTAAQSAA